MAVVFLLGYAGIALEHPLKINKSASAILLGAVLWILLALAGESVLVNTSGMTEYLAHDPGGTFITWLTENELVRHLGEISAILFFLLGAMTIVELVDSHGGFRILTDRIRTTRKSRLLWIISLVTFGLSAVLDNLTTAIVMVALLRKLLSDKKDRWLFAGMVIIAANSGGAFSPIGDVTTIMLWIGGHVTTVNIIVKTVIPSLVSLFVPLLLLSAGMKGEVQRPASGREDHAATSPTERMTVLVLGVGSLLFVPVFNALTGLPPYLGILLGLGVLWTATELMHKDKHGEIRPKVTVAGVLQRIDTPSILFFLGILLAVAALRTAGHLDLLAGALSAHIGNLYLINTAIGLLSAVVDNVPLVAGAIGMYGNTFPADHYFWEMLAYCAGTGGSILIIGSAAGVAVMGMEKISFGWYLKRISLPALAGYLAGAAVYWVLSMLVFG